MCLEERRSFRVSLGFTMPSGYKLNGKLQQLHPSRMTNSTYSSEMKVWATPLGKEPRPAEVLAEDRGNIEWVVEDSS